MEKMLEALRQAVEPAPEYCLFWIPRWWSCMSKSEWASWAQAVWAALALVIAVAVAWKSRKDVSADAHRAMRAFVWETAVIFDLMLKAVERHNADTYQVARHMLDEHKLMLGNIQVGPLRPDALRLFVEVKATLLSGLKSLPTDAPSNYQHVHAILRDAAASTKQRALEVAKLELTLLDQVQMRLRHARESIHIRARVRQWRLQRQRRFRAASDRPRQ